MGCCKLPANVEEKLYQVKKALRMKKINKVIRIAAELSWNDWDQDAVVGKLYPEFASVEKQGLKTKRNLHKIAEALTKELKGLNYNFPPLEKFCSQHMWFAEDAGGQSSTQQKAPEMPVASSRFTRSPTQERVNMTTQIRTHDIPEELLSMKRPSSDHLSTKDTLRVLGCSSSNLKSLKKNSKGKEKAQTCLRTFKSKHGRILMHAKDYRELFLPCPKISHPSPSQIK